MVRQRAQSAPQASQTGEPADSRRSFGRFRPGCGSALLLVLLAVATLVLLAPTIIARTSLLQRVVPLAAPQFPGSISIGSASLGWFSPVRLQDVAAFDSSGDPLARVQSISNNKTLLSLALSSSDLGEFRLDRPQLHLRLRDDGSNWEDALAPLLEPQGQTDAARSLTVLIADGSVQLQDTVAGKQWQIERLEGRANLPASDDPLTLRLAAQLAGSETAAGQLDADLSCSMTRGGQATLKTRQLPLELLQPLLRRYLVDAQLGGMLAADCQFDWSQDGGQAELRVNDLQLSHAEFQWPNRLGSDRIQLAALAAEGTLSLDGSQLTANGVRLTSDVAKLQADGELNLERLTRDQLLAALQQQDYRVSGEVDLAILADMFPQTLRIRQATEITSGKISATLFSRVENSRRRWLAALRTANLSARNNGRTVRLKQPIELTLSAADSSSGPTIEQLACRSSFLQLSGKGTLDNGSISVTGDLQQWLAELQQFVDLGELQMAGKLSADLAWQRDQNQHLTAQGDASVQQFILTAPPSQPWREEQLRVTLEAAGWADPQGIRRLEKGSIRVQSGEDQMVAQLTEPVENWTSQSTLPLRLKLNGDLATWQPRVRAWMPSEAWQLAGDTELVAEVSLEPGRIRITASQAAIKQFQARGSGLSIEEPEVRAQLTADYLTAQQQLVSQEATLASSSLSMRLSDLVVDCAQSATKISGSTAFRGDLSRIMAWTYDSPPSTLLYGMIVGQAHLTQHGDVTMIDAGADVEDFVVAQRRETSPSAPSVVATTNRSPWKSVWREKNLKLKLSGDFSQADQSARVASFTAATDAIQIHTQGQLSELSTSCHVDGRGQLAFEWSKLAELLRSYVSPDFQIAGSDSGKFAVHGPLRAASPVPTQLQAQGGLGWTSASLQGFQFGAGRLDATLQDGLLRIAPLDLPVNQGRLSLEPRVVLSSDPAELVHDRRAIVQRVQISPEMCRAWLKYLAPLLADATQAEGLLSVDLEQARLPLDDLASGRVSGTLQIHSAQVGPGSLGREFILIADQIRGVLKQNSGGLTGDSQRWIIVPQQSVEFQLAEGRVHHQGMQMQMGDVTIRTQGSVGLDQTLSLVAEVPILDDWVREHRFLAGLKGQVLRIPIRGTFARPQLDQQMVADLSKQLIGKSVESVIQDQLIKGLDGLFKPK